MAQNQLEVCLHHFDSQEKGVWYEVMRTGKNPLKDTGSVAEPKACRVVVPVYIPDQAGYFAQSLEVLRVCLESLHLTAGSQATITVVANGCSPAILAELLGMFGKGWLDSLVLSSRNLGKAGAIASVFKGAVEPLLAWADCDVLFKAGWLDAVLEVFNAFPECGAVAPFPAVNLAWHYTSATTLGAVATGCLRRESVVPLEDLETFSRSVGTPNLFREEHKRAQWVVRRGGVTACIGACHFVCCIRREVVKAMPKTACTAALNTESDLNYLDLPPERLGFWRLCTARSYVWHMGNVVEPWMVEYVEQLRATAASTSAESVRLPDLKRNLVSRCPLVTRDLAARVLKRLLQEPSRTTKNGQAS